MIHSENFLQGSVLGDAGAQSDLSPRPDSPGAPGWGRWSQTQREVPCPQGRARPGRDRDWRGQGGDKGSVQNSQANPPAEWALALGMEGQWEKAVLDSGQSIT